MLCFHVCLCTTCIQYLQRPDEGVKLPRTEVTDGCKPSYGAWDLNPSSPEEQSALLTNEPSHLSSPRSILEGWKVWFLIALSMIKSFCLFYMASGKGEMRRIQSKRMCLWQSHCLQAAGSSGGDFASSLLKSYPPPALRNLVQMEIAFYQWTSIIIEFGQVSKLLHSIAASKTSIQ